MNIKIFGTHAQLFVAGKYVGTIRYDKRKAKDIVDNKTEHIFYKSNEVIAYIDAKGGEYGGH